MPITAHWAMAASAAATSSMACRPSKRSRSAPMPKAAAGRSSACSNPATGRGCQLIVFTTGAGSVVGQAIAPIIKGVSNSRVFQRLSDDIDVNGGTIADGQETIQEVGEHILRKIVALASGEQSRSEALGHQEF